MRAEHTSREAAARAGAFTPDRALADPRPRDATSHRRPPRRLGARRPRAAALLVAWAVFARLPPMSVRVGRAAIDAAVPLGYQLSVFPAFGAFVGALALDVVRGDDRRTLLPARGARRLTGMLAVARIAGALPLSGHALFLFAVLGYELAPPADRDAHAVARARHPRAPRRRLVQARRLGGPGLVRRVGRARGARSARPSRARRGHDMVAAR